MSDLNSWLEEKRSAHLYLIMAANEANPVRKHLFEQLAHAADTQATIWEAKLKAANLTVPSSYQPDLRTRIVGILVKKLGPKRMRHVLATMKVRGLSVYLETPLLESLPTPPSKQEAWHKNAMTGGNLRAAVFGINDGLVSNASLILGIAGAAASQHFILLSGVAGLLAGACSMAAGEYISVNSQRELFQYQIQLEKDELENYPDEEAAELALIYQARGLPKNEAERLGKLLISNPDTALDILAREELGLNPKDLGSPKGAAISSFLCFVLGASLPVLPYLFGNHPWNLYFSIALTSVALFSTGVILSFFTNVSIIKSGGRMLLIGALAGGVTYLIGKILGVTLS